MVEAEAGLDVATAIGTATRAVVASATPTRRITFLSDIWLPFPLSYVGGPVHSGPLMETTLRSCSAPALGRAGEPEYPPLLDHRTGKCSPRPWAVSLVDVSTSVTTWSRAVTWSPLKTRSLVRSAMNSLLLVAVGSYLLWIAVAIGPWPSA